MADLRASSGGGGGPSLMCDDLKAETAALAGEGGAVFRGAGSPVGLDR